MSFYRVLENSEIIYAGFDKRHAAACFTESQQEGQAALLQVLDQDGRILPHPSYDVE